MELILDLDFYFAITVKSAVKSHAKSVKLEILRSRDTRKERRKGGDEKEEEEEDEDKEEEEEGKEKVEDDSFGHVLTYQPTTKAYLVAPLSAVRDGMS